jgi:hypothetical protein
MKPIGIRVAAAAALAALAFSCRRDDAALKPTPPAGPPVYLFHRDYGCEQNAPARRTASGRACLADHTWKNDTLSLTFRFNYICCSAFADTFSSSAQGIAILSTDTSTDHCRCMCEYCKDAVFEYSSGDPIRIVFRLQPWPPSPLEVLVDTLLLIR